MKQLPKSQGKLLLHPTKLPPFTLGGNNEPLVIKSHEICMQLCSPDVSSSLLYKDS